MENYLEHWTILRGRIRKETRNRMNLFRSPSEYREWVNSLANLGLATALRNRDKLDETRGNFNTFAFLQTRPLIRAELKREERHVNAKKEIAKERKPPQADQYEFWRDREELNQALKLISADQQEVLALYYEADLSPHEIGRIMERDRNAVDGLLFRARRRLKELMAEEPQLQRPLPLTTDLPPESKPRSHLKENENEEPPERKSYGNFQIIEGGRR